jgi:hypothetical protein
MARELTQTGRESGWLVAGAAVVLGIAGGLVSAFGRPELTVIALGLVLAALVVSSRTALFWFVVIGALVVTGVAQLYLPGSRYLRYVVPLASLGFLLHWLGDALARRDEPAVLPPPLVWGFAFVAISVISTLINLTDPVIALVGFKNYFQMWLFFLAFVFLRWDDSLPRRLYVGLLLIGLLQLPFAAHEYLVLSPRLVGLGEGIVPADVIAGTFGAMQAGGGANAVLAAFQVILVGLLLAMWKHGRLGTFWLVVSSAVLLTPLLVNQAKIAVLYLPLMFMVVFYRDILRRPGKFLFAGAGLAGLVAVLLTALLLTNPSGQLGSWSELAENVVARQTASVDERQGQYAELSRWTALTFWAQQHAHADPVHTLLGHGPGATREPEGGGLGVTGTLAQRKYGGLRIGYTAVSALLWEVGVVGLLTVIGMLVSAFVAAGQLARYYAGRSEFRSALFDGLRAAIAVLLLSLAHKDFFVVHLPYQALVYLILGYIGYEWLRVARDQDEDHA